MNTAGMHDRNRYINALRAYANLLETDATVPAAQIRLVPVRFDSPAALATFAAVNQLDAPADDGKGNACAVMWLGPIAYRAFARTAKTAKTVKAVTR